MSKSLRIVQLNVKKQGTKHDSLMNDADLQDAAVILIQEPQARLIQGKLLTTPMLHHRWTKITPSEFGEGRWAIRSMMWINKELNAEQVSTGSPDLTAAVIRLEYQLVLVVSVYIEGQDDASLRDTCITLRSLINDAKRYKGLLVEVVLIKDFNYYN